MKWFEHLTKGTGACRKTVPVRSYSWVSVGSGSVLQPQNRALFLLPVGPDQKNIFKREIKQVEIIR